MRNGYGVPIWRRRGARPGLLAVELLLLLQSCGANARRTKTNCHDAINKASKENFIIMILGKHS